MKTHIGQIADRLTFIVDNRVDMPKDASRPFPCATDFRMVINSKFPVGDATTAVIIITSTAEFVTALRLASPIDLRPPPTESVSQTSTVSEEEVMVALKTIRPSNAGLDDELRADHLMDLVALLAAERVRRLYLYMPQQQSMHIQRNNYSTTDSLQLSMQSQN